MRTSALDARHGPHWHATAKETSTGTAEGASSICLAMGSARWSRDPLCKQSACPRLHTIPTINTESPCFILAASRQKCRDAGKIDYHHGVQIKQTALSGDCVQSRLHPRVGLDSQPGRCGRSCIPQVYPTRPAGSTALVMVSHEPRPADEGRLGCSGFSRPSPCGGVCSMNTEPVSRRPWDDEGRLSVRTCHVGDQIRFVLALRQ